MEKLLILFHLNHVTGTTINVGFIVFVQPSLAPATDWILAIVIGLLGVVQHYVLVWAAQLKSPVHVTRDADHDGHGGPGVGYRHPHPL